MFADPDPQPCWSDMLQSYRYPEGYRKRPLGVSYRKRFVSCPHQWVLQIGCLDVLIFQAGEVTYTNTHHLRSGEGIVEFGSRLVLTHVNSK